MYDLGWEELSPYYSFFALYFDPYILNKKMSNISWVPYFKPLQFVIPSYSSINGIKGLGGKYKKGWHGDKILVHFKNLEPSVTTNSRGLI